MSKKLILLFVTCLLVTSCLFGCGDDTKLSDDNPTTTPKVESTTKEDVTTTEPTTAESTTPPETTTQEPTTEEPSTEYMYKGVKFIIESHNKDLFVDLVVEKGHKFNVNDFVDKDVSEVIRGVLAFDLVAALFQNNDDAQIEFESKYLEPGTTKIKISYSQNVVIEYSENEKLYFHLVEEDNGFSYFDVYEID